MNVAPKLTPFHATCLVIGNLVGTGVFLLPTALSQYGWASVPALGVAVVGALCIAWLFARMAERHPGQGGIYFTTRLAFGDFSAFLVACTYWAGIWLGNCATALGIGIFLVPLFPELKDPGWNLGFSLILLWILTAVQCRGVLLGARLNSALTVMKLIPMLLIPLGALFFQKWENFEGMTAVSSEGMMPAILLSMWCFVGIEVATIPAQSIENPRRTIPRATLMGTFLVGSFYLLSYLVLIGMFGVDQLRVLYHPFSIAAEEMLPFSSGGIVVLVSVVTAISGIGSLNGWILLQGQMPLAAAKDGLMPKFFSHVNRAGAPVRGIILSSLCSSGLMFVSLSECAVDQYLLLISLATFCILIGYLFPIAAARFLIFDREPLKGKMRILFSLAWVASFGLLLVSFYGGGSEVIISIFFIIVLLCPLYMVFKNQKR